MRAVSGKRRVELPDWVTLGPDLIVRCSRCTLDARLEHLLRAEAERTLGRFALWHARCREPEPIRSIVGALKDAGHTPPFTVTERRVSRGEVIAALVKREAVESASADKGKRPRVLACAHCKALIATKKKGQLPQYCRNGGKCQREADRQRMLIAADAARFKKQLEERLPLLVGPPDFEAWMFWRVLQQTGA